MTSRTKYQWAIEALRQQLETLADRKRGALHEAELGREVAMRGEKIAQECDTQMVELGAAISALIAQEKRDLLGHPHPNCEWHPTHRVETSVRRACNGDIFEATYCTQCGAGDPSVEEQHKKTDPCVRRRMVPEQDFVVDELGPVQPR